MIPSRKATNQKEGYVDYRLHLLGIGIWQQWCQLIARGDGTWVGLGPKRPLPLEIPRNEAGVKAAGQDSLLLTAWQYEQENAGTDLREVLAQRTNFEDLLAEDRPSARHWSRGAE